MHHGWKELGKALLEGRVPAHRHAGVAPNTAFRAEDPLENSPELDGHPDFYVGRVPGPRHGPVVRGGEPGSLSTVPRRGGWLTPFWAVPVL